MIYFPMHIGKKIRNWLYIYLSLESTFVFECLILFTNRQLRILIVLNLKDLQLQKHLHDRLLIHLKDHLRSRIQLHLKDHLKSRILLHLMLQCHLNPHPRFKVNHLPSASQRFDDWFTLFHVNIFKIMQTNFPFVSQMVCHNYTSI